MTTRLALALSLLVSAAAPALASAQVAVNVQIGLPAAPPLVVVQPGVQVVQDFHEEVFYTGGWYWCRRGDVWYRARGPRASFVHVEPRYVPVAIRRLPPGQYKHWHRAEAKAERKAWKRWEKAERRDWKEDRGHGHDEGHGHDGRGHGGGHGHGHD